jgi:TolA-binding protein
MSLSRHLSRLQTLILIAGMVLGAGLNVGCTSNSPKKQYLLAEKLWTDGRYAAAVAEFDKVTAKDPKGKLGLQARYRAATTRMLFLSQFGDAVRGFKAYSEAPGAEPELAWDARKQIGEILFSKTEQYDLAIQHYEGLLKQRPEAPEAPEFQFRVGKSHFFLWHFDDAVETYRKVTVRFPGTSWAEKAAYETGVTYFTRGEQRAGGDKGKSPGSESYQEAIAAYQKFLRQYPQSPWAAQAKFGIAACLEEMDQLDAAYHAYETLKSTYPSPNVIAIKLARIREREAQRSH